MEGPHRRLAFRPRCGGVPSLMGGFRHHLQVGSNQLERHRGTCLSRGVFVWLLSAVSAVKISVQPGKAQIGDLARTGKHPPRPLHPLCACGPRRLARPHTCEIGRTRLPDPPQPVTVRCGLGNQEGATLAVRLCRAPHAPFLVILGRAAVSSNRNRVGCGRSAPSRDPLRSSGCRRHSRRSS